MSAYKKQTMTWDAANDQRLLLAILNQLGDHKLDFETIAPMLSPHCSVRAVQERVKKLRKDARATFDETSPNYTGNNSTNGPKTTDTPTRTKPGRKKKTATTTTDNDKTGKATGEPVVTDDEEVDEKPVVAAKAKPKRQRSKPSKETVTVEDDEEEDEHSVDEAEFAAVNEGPVNKKRKYADPSAVDAPLHQNIGTAAANEARAAYEGSGRTVTKV